MSKIRKALTSLREVQNNDAEPLIKNDDTYPPTAEGRDEDQARRAGDERRAPLQGHNENLPGQEGHEYLSTRDVEVDQSVRKYDEARSSDRAEYAETGGKKVQLPLDQVEDLAQSGLSKRNTDSSPGTHIRLDIPSLINCGLMPDDDHKELIAQQFRRIKRPVLQCAFQVNLPVGENANVIMMASALPGSGKSFCAFNLVQSISIERDVGAVIVDADVLKPSLSRDLGLENHVGLIDYLVDPSMELTDILVQTDSNGIVIIPAGRQHAEATELLASRRMSDLVSRLSSIYRNRAVIFDAPPLLLTNEAQVLAEMMGQIILVIEARISSQESVIRAVAMLDRDKPINAIINKSRSDVGGGYPSDEYGYYPYSGRRSSE